MTNIWWEWPTRRTGFDELVVDFTIHNDVELAERQGYYLMLAFGSISDADFYFGIQTNVHSPIPPYTRGKAVIFSRWDERDLGLAKWDEMYGFAQSSGHEGDFIGVRRLYDWGIGDYRARLAPEGLADEHGRWFSLWVTDLATEVTTWVGSLRFPLVDRNAQITKSVYSTMEIYGAGPVRPIDLPVWHVSIAPPRADGELSTWGVTSYSAFTDAVLNTEIYYDARANVVGMTAGGLTERKSKAGVVRFK
ncbi:MAG: hypothetical protein F4X83_03310 [Chloroflexi bacterium]|nr:hypothetical protein [Chloroflexota bacterium]